MQRDPVTRQQARLRRELRIDRALQGLRARPGIREQRVADRIGDDRDRNPQGIVAERLRGQLLNARHAAADAHIPLEIRGMLAIRLGDDEYGERTVRLGVQGLDPVGGIARVAGAVET